MESGVRHLHVVSEYQHLGCLLHHRGDLRKEMRRRFGMAHAAFNRHRRFLFQNRDLPLSRRKELFNTLVLSKLLFGAETWTLQDARDKRYIHCALLRLYARLLPGGRGIHRSDGEILRATGLWEPTTLLRMCRLRYLGQLYGLHRQACWGLFNADQTWCELIWDDLRWMWLNLERSSHLKDPAQHFPQWEYIMCNHASYWKRLVRRAGDHDTGQRNNIFVVETFHQDFLRILHHQGRVPALPPATSASSSSETFACMQCSRSFKTKGGCGAHFFKAHGHFGAFQTWLSYKFTYKLLKWTYNHVMCTYNWAMSNLSHV